MNCAIYPRKSKKNDNTDSMELQVDACTDYINKHFPGANIIVYGADYGVTGHSTEKRKDFLRMMDDIKAKKINTVVILKYDRLARNMRDFCNIYYEMESSGCTLVSVSQQIDTSTPYGKTFMYQLASMAELEWSTISERYKDSARYKVAQGRPYTGSLPFGYKIDVVDGVKRVVKDNEEIVMAAFNRYKECKNKNEVARYIRANYTNDFTVGIFNNMLKSDLYFGKAKDNYNFCEPYFSESEMMEFRTTKVIKQTPSNNHYLFSRLLICPVCGSRLYSEYANRCGKTYIYYRCIGSGREREELHRLHISIRQSIVEDKLLKSLNVFVDKNISVSTAAISQNKNIADTVKNRRNLEEKIKRLNYMFENGRIGMAEYDQKYNNLQKELKDLSIVTSPVDRIDKLQQIKSSLLDANYLDMYNSLSDKSKMEYWHSLIKEVHMDEDKNIIDIIFA